MNDLEANLVTALMLGLVGSTHCLGMCGGIATSLGMTNQQTRHRYWQLFSYNFGRIGSYALIGAALAWVTTVLQTQMGMLSIVFRGLAGLMLVAMGLYISGWWMGLTQLEQLGQGLWKPVQKLTQPFTRSGNRFAPLVLGLSWGLLPCGLIYSTLVWSSSIASNGAESALLMTCFGLGTLPAMLLLGHLGQTMRSFLQRRGVRKILGFTVILMGLWTLIVPFQHLGHHHGNVHEHSSSADMNGHSHHHH